MAYKDVFAIQETIRPLEFISVPWIQQKFGLSYREARQFLDQLMLRGWIGKQAQGNRYRVCPEKMLLRSIQRSEVDTLYEEITLDCTAALIAILGKNGSGAVFSHIANAVKDEEGTKAALEILLKCKLIYLADDVYFSCVSRKTSEVLGQVVRVKRRNRTSRQLGVAAEEDETVKAMFEVLFLEDA